MFSLNSKKVPFIISAIILASLLAMSFFVLPLHIYAAEDGSGASGESGSGPSGIQNPLKKTTSFYQFIQKFLQVVLRIGTIIVALAIIYSGFLFVAARGNESKLEEAKRAFTYTIIGAIILLGSWVLAEIIEATITSITSP